MTMAGFGQSKQVSLRSPTDGAGDAASASANCGHAVAYVLGSCVPLATVRTAANTESFGTANQRLGNDAQTLCNRYMAVRIHAVRRRLDLMVSACGTPSPSAIIAYR